MDQRQMARHERIGRALGGRAVSQVFSQLLISDE